MHFTQQTSLWQEAPLVVMATRVACVLGVCCALILAAQVPLPQLSLPDPFTTLAPPHINYASVWSSFVLTRKTTTWLCYQRNRSHHSSPQRPPASQLSQSQRPFQALKVLPDLASVSSLAQASPQSRVFTASLRGFLGMGSKSVKRTKESHSFSFLTDSEIHVSISETIRKGNILFQVLPLSVWC